MRETKSRILRRAILSIPYDRNDIPDLITTENVLSRWPLLSTVGYTPTDIVRMANISEESALSDSVMAKLMDALNWYSEYHS